MPFEDGLSIRGGVRERARYRSPRRARARPRSAGSPRSRSRARRRGRRSRASAERWLGRLRRRRRHGQPEGRAAGTRESCARRRNAQNDRLAQGRRAVPGRRVMAVPVPPAARIGRSVGQFASMVPDPGAERKGSPHPSTGTCTARSGLGVGVPSASKSASELAHLALVSVLVSSRCPPFRVLCGITCSRGARLSRSNATKAVWSWGESKPPVHQRV